MTTAVPRGQETRAPADGPALTPAGRLGQVAELLPPPCRPPGSDRGSLCRCGSGDLWPCRLTRAAWLAAGLDPGHEEQAARATAPAAAASPSGRTGTPADRAASSWADRHAPPWNARAWRLAASAFRAGYNAGAQDDRLRAEQAAELAGAKVATWRAYVSRGQAPQPDGRFDGRTPWWWRSTVEQYVVSRPGRGSHSHRARPARR